MRAATIIFSSVILAGLLLVTVESLEAMTGTNAESTTRTTVGIQCGINMNITNCYPCNQICNSPALSCALDCVNEFTQCKCEFGYYLPTRNSTYCVALNDCPPSS